MDRYSNKYGFNGADETILSFHRQRRMFVVKDGELKLASVGSPLSHAQWFESLGWMSPEHDEIMEELTRGYVDSTGVYAYTGFDFKITKKVEQDVLKVIKELSDALDVLPKAHVYLGLTKPSADNPRWQPSKNIGTIESLVLGLTTSK